MKAERQRKRKGLLLILVPVLLMNNLIFGQLAVVLVLVSPVFTRSPSQPLWMWIVEPGVVTPTQRSQPRAPAPPTACEANYLITLSNPEPLLPLVAISLIKMYLEIFKTACFFSTPVDNDGT